MADARVIKIVDRIAPRYDDFWGVGCESAHFKVLDYAESLGLQPRRLLDIGCGTGKLLVRAQERWPGCELFGLDPSAPMVERARVKLPQATVFLDGVERIPLADASIDLVLSTTSFCCWEDKTGGLREVGRVLRPGGHCVLVDRPAPNIFRKIVMIILDWDLPFQTLSQIEQHARSANLEICKLAFEDGYNFLHATGSQ